MRILLWAALLVGGLWSNESAAAADLNKVEDWLNNRMYELLSSCLPGEGVIKLDQPFGTKKVAYIPTKLYTALKLGQAPLYVKLVNSNFTRAFGYVFPAAGQSSALATNRYLSLVYSNDLDQIFNLGLDYTTYTVDCRSTLKAAVSASVGLQLSAATLKAAGQASLDNTFQESLQLSEGTFKSPLWSLWNGSEAAGGSDPRSKVFAAFVFWDWYRRNPSQSTGNKLITALNGYALYRYTEDTGVQSAEIEQQSGIKIPFLSFESSASASMSRSTKLISKKYEILLKTSTDGSDAIEYASLPSIDEVVAAITDNLKYTTIFFTGAKDVVFSNSTLDFYVDIPLVPKAICEANFEIEEGDGIKIVGSSYQSEMNSLPGCRHQIRYSSGAITESGPLALSFYITLKEKVADRKLRLPITVQVQRNDKPKQALLSASPIKAKKTVSNGRTELSWKVIVQVTDEGKITSGDQIDVTGIAPTCIGLESDFIVDKQVPARNSSAQRRFELIITTEYEGQIADDVKTDECAVEGIVSYRIDGAERRRPLPGNTRILVPRP